MCGEGEGLGEEDSVTWRRRGRRAAGGSSSGRSGTRTLQRSTVQCSAYSVLSNIKFLTARNLLLFKLLQLLTNFPLHLQSPLRHSAQTSGIRYPEPFLTRHPRCTALASHFRYTHLHYTHLHCIHLHYIDLHYTLDTYILLSHYIHLH